MQMNIYELSVLHEEILNNTLYYNFSPSPDGRFRTRLPFYMLI